MHALSTNFAIYVYKRGEGLCVKFKFANFWCFFCKHQSNISIVLNMGLFALLSYEFYSDIKCVIECDEAGG